MSHVYDVSKRVFFSLFFFIGCSFIADSNAIALDNQAAKPFSDPSFVIDMDRQWQGKPVTYTNGAKGSDLSIIVNQQLSAVLIPMIDKFATDRKLNISAEIGTCGISAGALSRKEVDMGGFCCPPGKVDRLPGLKYHTLGITPLLLLVDKDNTVDSVTVDEARLLFEGKITNWKELGGRDMAVRPMGMLHCKKRPGHWRLILGNAKLFSPEFKVTGDIEDTINMTASTPGSIGFEIMMNVIKLKSLDRVKVLKVENHDPLDLDRLNNGDYPFYRTLNITTWEGSHLDNPLAQELLEYLLKTTQSADPAMAILPSAEMKKAGWKFNGGELIGEAGN